MTRLTKKVLTWLLGTFAFMALALGIAFGRPQIKKASAETITTTWAESFSVQSINDYKRYLIQTPALAWTSYNNESYADEYLAYTKLNGKTVKEINEAAAANGSTEKIWACLQPAGSFSFYSVCVPNSFSELLPTEIRSFSIEPGWTHLDSSTNPTYPGTGNTYTTEGVRYDLIGSTWRLITNYIDLDGGDIIVSNQGELYTDVNCFIIRFGAHDSIAGYMCLNDNYQKVSSITSLSYGENLDYITINGKTIGQIKAENPDYDYSTSAHPNIKNGGLYAPIFAHISSADLGRGTENFLQIFIPTDLIDPSTVTEIGLKARLFNYSSSAPNTKYGLTQDVTFVKENGVWVEDESAKKYTVTVDGVAQTVQSGGYAVEPETPTKAEDENYTYTFDNWYIVDTDTVFDFSTPIKQNYNIEARFTATKKIDKVSVSFTATLDKNVNATYGKSIRFSTVGLQWSSYHNWVSAADWASIADYTFINGKSVTEINAGITEGQKLTLMMQPAETFSFLRVYIPEAVLSIDDIQVMAIKKGWAFNNGEKEYVAENTQYFYRSNSNSAIAEVTNYLSSDDVTISNWRVDGVQNELYKVDITSSKWKITTSNEYNYNYFGDNYQNVRKNIYINGVSIYDINTLVNDSSYVYSTWPMTQTDTDSLGSGFQLFANPVLLYTPVGGDTLTLWIHKDYIASLGAGDITITLGVGLTLIAGGDILLEETSAAVSTRYAVTIKNDDGAVLDTQTVTKGKCAVAPETPTKAEDENYTYTFDNWYIADTDTVFDFATAITQNYNIVARFTPTAKEKTVEVEWTSGNFEPNIDNGTDTRLRFNTSALAWTANVNKTTDDQYLAYTKLNGRTVKEINEAAAKNGSTELIFGRLQGAGSFSFYALFIPKDFTEISAEDVYTVTIEAGWQHKDSGTNGTGNTYVNNITRTWYFRDKSFQEASNAKDINATANFTFANQGDQGNGSTCFILNTRDRTGLWTAYSNTFKVGYPILNHIYINDKSIKDWNAEAQAAVDSGAATDILYGSMHTENSNAGGPIAVLPGYADAEAHGAFFQIFIANNFLPASDIYSFEWKEDFSFMFKESNNLYYMSEGVKFEKINGAWVNTNDIYTVTVQDYDGTVLDTQRVVSGQYASAPSTTPSRPMTSTAIYTFAGWKDSEGNDFNFASTTITSDITVIAQYNEQPILIKETEIVSVQFQFHTTVNTWLIFELSNHDYTYDIANGIDMEANRVTLDELRAIGFLDSIILRGDLLVGGEAVSEATLAQIIDPSPNKRNTALINAWGEGFIGIRVPDLANYDAITEIVVKAGTCFPSYEYICAKTTSTDTRFMVYLEKVFQAGTAQQGVDGEGNPINSWTTPFGAASSSFEISMADGAAIRLASLDNYDGSQNYMETEGYKLSGIRFQTLISKASITQLQRLLGSIYKEVSFGTLIVPSADIMGGDFSHEWLKANGIKYMDIPSSAWLTADGYAFAAENDDYVTFFGSIVNLKAANHSRYFSGVGYIKVVKTDDEEVYFYAPMNDSCSRSASYIAQAAVADRNDTQNDNYDNEIETGSWSPYTAGEITFLKLYMGTLVNTEVAAQAFTLTSTGAFGWDTTTANRNTGTVAVNKALNGAYVKLSYQTNIDVWGKFYYQNNAGTKSAVEDFYLPKGSSEHKQYLDLFRKNGVGKELAADDLYLTKMEFQNATVDTSSSGTFKFLGLYSSDKTLDTEKLQVYVTKELDAGGDMTVGAHLGLGGALTYLAKSGLYEGATSSGYNSGSILLRQNTNEFVSKRYTNKYYTSNEKGWYGAESSRPENGAVNLINNYDAGRQVQQSWYANVGGSLSGNTGANGYRRLSCSTGDGGYWPYNPVQAGDCVSNPGQIIDYEVNETEGYIYVKARAMDWAYGDTSKGGYEYGSTTKSYMENYYRLNSDGTLYVNNSFVDWNGFTNMDTCDFCLVELPAFYPIQSLNHFFTYDGASPWTNGALTHKDDLSSWTSGGNSHYQSAIDGSADGSMGEEWVAWANDASGSIAFGMYIPNVTRFTSGRSATSINTSISTNVNAADNLLKSKGLMSNMQPVSYSYQGTYVQNTSYTAPGISFKMAAYVPIEYTYVLSVNDITTIRSQFKAIHDSRKVTNAGRNQGDKVGLDAWARSDKIWTQV